MMGHLLNIKRPLLTTTVVFGFLLFIGFWLVNLTQQAATQDKMQLASQVAYTQAKNLEKELHTALIASTQILAFEVIQNQGNMDNFTSYAKEILSISKLISNLQLAPEGVIRRIYPLEGNEQAIGHDLLKDDRRKKEAIAALQSSKLTLAGPFRLKQGGVGLVARRPVFLDPNDQETFWGFASALILLDKLINSSDLIKLKKDNLDFQLSRLHPDTGQMDVFYGVEIPSHWISAATTIEVPNNQWTLTVGLPVTDNWLSSVLINSLVVVVISSSLSLFFYYYATLPNKLQKAVDEKTVQLVKLANTDMLTGLHNRRRFTEILNDVILHSEQRKEHYALLFLDLDNFKLINDQYGHSMGDQVLVDVSQHLIDVFDTALTITRISGDEFAVILPYQHRHEVEQLADKAIQTIADPNSSINNHRPLSASMGIVLVPQDGNSVAQVMQHVDFAMYQAKQAGRCQYQFFDREIKHADLERMLLMQDLKNAIREQQLLLHYQPIYQLTNRDIHCYEALVRWQHPKRGLLYPGDFIEEAEKTAVIHELGYCVMELACQFIADNNEFQPIVAINLSANQLTDVNIFSRFKQIIEKYQVSPSCLKLELTETTLMTNLEQSKRLLHKFNDLGISIAIDDFGTGYSSLAVLKDIPATYLKIDKTFIDKINSNKGDLKVAQSIITLAHNLDMKVIAEGIETYQQEFLLEQLKCDFGQGFLFGRPALLELSQTQTVNT